MHSGIIEYMILNPEETIKQLLIRDDSRVADFGAGSGVFALAAMKYIHTGKIFVVDIQRGLLSRIMSNVPNEYQKNIEIIWGDIEEVCGSRIKSDSVDIVIFTNMLFQIVDKNSATTEIKRILKDKGQLLVVDWEGSFGNMGPKEEDIFSKEEAVFLFNKNGFVLSKEVPAGDFVIVP